MCWSTLTYTLKSYTGKLFSCLPPSVQRQEHRLCIMPGLSELLRAFQKEKKSLNSQKTQGLNSNVLQPLASDFCHKLLFVRKFQYFHSQWVKFYSWYLAHLKWKRCCILDFLPAFLAMFSLWQGSVVTLYFLESIENTVPIEKSKPSMYPLNTYAKN